MKSLRELRANPPVKIFTDAKILPAFFQTNLVDEARVVKAFLNDPQANIKVFYYQYLKLCFQIETVNYEFYIQKIEELINNETFKFIFFEDDDPALFNDMQFKKLIMDFFGVLSEGACSIEESLGQYPIMDTVFVYFFRTLMILIGRTDVLDSWMDRDELFEFLAGYFSVEISVHNRCLKFVETDIFVYEQDPRQVYMAFMDYDQDHTKLNPPPQYKKVEEPKQQQPKPKAVTIVEPTPQQSLPVPVPQNEGRRQASQINQSYIASEWMDYSETNNVSKLSALAKPQIQKLHPQASGNVQNFNQIINSGIKAAEEAKKSQTSIYSVPAKDTVSLNATNQQNDYFNAGSSKYSYEDSSYSSNKFGQVPSTNTVQADKYYQAPKQEYADISSIKKASPGYGQTELPKTEWQPTKDPGFETNFVSNVIGPFNDGSKYLNSQVNASFQPSKYQENSSYQKPTADPYSYSKPSVNDSYQKPIVDSYSYQKPAPADIYQKPVDSYQPKPPSVSQPYGKKSPVVDSYQPKPSSYGIDSFSANSYQNKPIDAKPSSQSGANYFQSNAYSYDIPKPASSVSGKRSVFGLNISQEFTNDETLKIIVEPQRSNISTMKQRARAFRNSLSGYAKP